MFLECIGVGVGQKLTAAVSKAFVKVGVKVVGDGAVLLCSCNFLFAGGKFLEASATLQSCLVVGVSEVGNGYRLRAVVLANPVGVRQVDSDWRGREAVATESNNINGLCRNTLYLFLLETLVNRAVILEPLCVFADELGHLGGFDVLEVNNCFPSSLKSQRVAVVFDEAVYIINARVGIFCPHHIVFVPSCEVASIVVFNKFAQFCFLYIAFCKFDCLFKVFDNLFDCFAVHSANFVGAFHNISAISSL